MSLFVNLSLSSPVDPVTEELKLEYYIPSTSYNPQEVAMYVSLMMASSEDDLAFLKENGFCVEYFGIAHVREGS